MERKDLNKYHVGVDLAYTLKWWQKLLVKLHICKRSRFQDYSCSVVWKELPNGNLELVYVNYF